MHLEEVQARPMGWLCGHGYIGGDPPATPDPDDPDGRYKLLNVPSQGRVDIYERRSRICVASVISESDGTWQVMNLNEALHYFVVGFDDRMLQNAAIQDWIVPAPMV